MELTSTSHSDEPSGAYGASWPQAETMQTVVSSPGEMAHLRQLCPAHCTLQQDPPPVRRRSSFMDYQTATALTPQLLLCMQWNASANSLGARTGIVEVRAVGDSRRRVSQRFPIRLASSLPEVSTDRRV
jgi:hypothetical protein